MLLLIESNLIEVCQKANWTVFVNCEMKRMQNIWKHSVNKLTIPVDGGINLVFNSSRLTHKKQKREFLKASNRSGFTHWDYPSLHGHKTLEVAQKLRNLAEVSESKEIMVSAEDWNYL